MFFDRERFVRVTACVSDLVTDLVTVALRGEEDDGVAETFAVCDDVICVDPVTCDDVTVLEWLWVGVMECDDGMVLVVLRDADRT